MVQPELRLAALIVKHELVGPYDFREPAVARLRAEAEWQLIPELESACHAGMVLHGKVHGGVVVLDEGERLPEGARVSVIPEAVASSTPAGSDEMTPEKHARLLSVLDRIVALPIEGDTDSFSGADHDRVLYGEP